MPRTGQRCGALGHRPGMYRQGAGGRALIMRRPSWHDSTCGLARVDWVFPAGKDRSVHGCSSILSPPD